MANKIKIKRGLSTYIDNLTLEPGEIAVVLDTRDLKVGNSDGEVTGINAATATALQETITINGIDFDGTSSVKVIEAGDHIGINDAIISVTDMGTLADLLTTEQSSLVSALNEVVLTTKENAGNITTLSNSTANSITQLNSRIDDLSTNPDIDVSSLTNDLMTLNNEQMSVGNSSTRLQMTNDGDLFQIKNGTTSVIEVGLNETTNSVQTTISSLNVSGKADIGSHRVQTFTVNGENRTGWFYNGGAN